MSEVEFVVPMVRIVPPLELAARMVMAADALTSLPFAPDEPLSPEDMDMARFALDHPTAPPEALYRHAVARAYLEGEAEDWETLAFEARLFITLSAELARIVHREAVAERARLDAVAAATAPAAPAPVIHPDDAALTLHDDPLALVSYAPKTGKTETETGDATADQGATDAAAAPGDAGTADAGATDGNGGADVSAATGSDAATAEGTSGAELAGDATVMNETGSETVALAALAASGDELLATGMAAAPVTAPAPAPKSKPSKKK